MSFLASPSSANTSVQDNNNLQTCRQGSEFAGGFFRGTDYCGVDGVDWMHAGQVLYRPDELGLLCHEVWLHGMSCSTDQTISTALVVLKAWVENRPVRWILSCCKARVVLHLKIVIKNGTKFQADCCQSIRNLGFSEPRFLYLSILKCVCWASSSKCCPKAAQAENDLKQPNQHLKSSETVKEYRQVLLKNLPKPLKQKFNYGRTARKISDP